MRYLTWCSRCALVSLLFLFSTVFLVSCGGPEAVETEAASQARFSEPFVDWNELDHRFWRRYLATDYFFKRLDPRDPQAQYRAETNFRISRAPVDLAAFRTLPPHEKEARRKESGQRLRASRKIKGMIDRGWELWTLTYDLGNPKAVVDEVNNSEMGPVTDTIRDLRAAVALDPSNPVAGYDLAYFAGLVGDRDLQEFGLNSALAAVNEKDPGSGLPHWESSPEMGLLRLRLLLDKAWALRSCGRYAEAEKQVLEAARQMKNDDQGTFAEAFEANLLQALIIADSGEIDRARALARDIPDLKLPRPAGNIPCPRPIPSRWRAASPGTGSTSAPCCGEERWTGGPGPLARSQLQG
jgi:tetratricopeptide (TPR) repeat protein